jgi:hypothetical protein
VHELLEHVAEAWMPQVMTQTCDSHTDKVTIRDHERRLPHAQIFDKVIGKKGGAYGVLESIVGCTVVNTVANTQLFDVSHALENIGVNDMLNVFR